MAKYKAIITQCDALQGDADAVPAKAQRRKRAPLLDLSTVEKLTRG